MKRCLLLLLAIIAAQFSHSQRYMIRNGHVWLYSLTPIEQFEAHNNQVVSTIEPSTGSLQFSMLIQSFTFENAIMQEHFNENYMESDKYPKADFAGIIRNLEEIRFEGTGTYQAEVTGDLYMHGVTKSLTTRGTIQVLQGEIAARATFIVKPVDFGIVIPAITASRIASEIEVHVDVSYPVE